MTARPDQGCRRQRGATMVEFAIVAGLLVSLLIGIMEMGRMLFYWNATTEATRLGARLAVVCDFNDPDIKAKMVSFFLSLLPATSPFLIYHRRRRVAEPTPPPVRP